jgi:hypothetical protein
MKKINLYKAALGVCLLLLVTVIIMALAGKGAATGPLLILMFIILSFAVKGFQRSRACHLLCGCLQPYARQCFIHSYLFPMAISRQLS